MVNDRHTRTPVTKTSSMFPILLGKDEGGEEHSRSLTTIVGSVYPGSHLFVVRLSFGTSVSVSHHKPVGIRTTTGREY